MTNGKSSGAFGKVVQFDHIVFWVQNAKTASTYFITRYGFSPLGFKNSTADNPIVSYAVKLNQIIFIFESPTILSEETSNITQELSTHGDFVKDLAFEVQDLDQLVKRAVEGGAEVVKSVTEESDSDGVIRYAVLKTFGSNTHTLIDRSRYKGQFLPGYLPSENDPLNKFLPKVNLKYIDHVESNVAEDSLEDTIAWYEKNLSMQRFWCADHLEQDFVPYSGLNSGAVANGNDKALLSFNQTATTKFLRPTSKVQDYVKAFGSSGVEHIALYTDDIVATMRDLKSRGAEIVPFPPSYFDLIQEKLKDSLLNITESIDAMREFNILIDFDERGYLLQAFMGHLQARPTVFIEIIQRKNHRGFGYSNYKWVFEAIQKSAE